LAALDGVRIIDLTQFEAGTSCTETLAWLGADVIKIEPPGLGEQGRRASTDSPDKDSYYFMLLNANKRSVVLDLKTEDGKKILWQLIEHADVFIENFGPGTIERLGFDYESVQNVNARIVYAQIKGYDPDGPYGAYLSQDHIAQASGGAVSITGFPDTPMSCGPTVADTGSGLHMAIGILAALYQRKSTGKGQHVRLAMQEAVINYCRIAYARVLQSGKAAGRYGNGSAMGNAPSELYPCDPGGPNDLISVYISRNRNTRQWDRLLDAIGRGELKGDPRFETAELRGQHKVEVDEIISSWTRGRSKEEAMRVLCEAGVPAAAMFDTLDLMTDPHLRSNGTFTTVNHPHRGEVVMPGWPVRMSSSSVPVVAAPLLGEHTAQVLKEVLGIEEPAAAQAPVAAT
jgi:formyl-CoA transferase